MNKIISSRKKILFQSKGIKKKKLLRPLMKTNQLLTVLINVEILLFLKKEKENIIRAS